jgi:hypothetical protein
MNRNTICPIGDRIMKERERAIDSEGSIRPEKLINCRRDISLTTRKTRAASPFAGAP